MKGMLRRKQISLDLLGPNDFFSAPLEEEEELATGAADRMPTMKEDEEEGIEDKKDELLAKEEEMKKLFGPLRFSKPMKKRTGGSGGHGGRPSSSGTEDFYDEEVSDAFERYAAANAQLETQVNSMKAYLKDEGVLTDKIFQASKDIERTQAEVMEDEALLKKTLLKKQAGEEVAPSETPDIQSDDGIAKASKSDKIKAIACFFIMLALTIVICAWKTHEDEESYLRGPVGLACQTNCTGSPDKDFFAGHAHFKSGQVIELTMHMDPNYHAHHAHEKVYVEVFGHETETLKKVIEFHPPLEERETEHTKFTVDFETPEEFHVLNIYTGHSSESDIDYDVSFTLAAKVLSPLAQKSEIVAACIMIIVYILILLEVVHRTLVAIAGSMVALMFYFIMHRGETESLPHIMGHMEWSTLGLLFGMMLLVGELSHTGIFEFCAVRLLVASKGSFVRLNVLLCSLTAVASAFLDNVTTMLLVAPVTIDMCNILDVDPRPYLIGEVILSNIGGTATLIGDPPNIIIGSSFEDIGFVDFIVHILPAIFLICIPVSLLCMNWIYRYYFTANAMKTLDTDKLKKTYPIYDEPRLLIAGTVTAFVILLFFLHPVHHKDTAWIALLGAFVTIAFTNPHDVQDVLRNHVEWDTLLFFAGLFVLVEVCASMGLLSLIGNALANYIESQAEEKQLSVAITMLLWVSAFTSAFLDNIPYTATMIPVVKILADSLDTLPLKTLAWALSFGACLGGNGTLLGASANIVTAGISTNKGFEISFLNFLYPGMVTMIITTALANLYMLIRYAW
jgi:Na+/H+ antiporter NhaD/arsenite permease-like protein